MKPFVFFCAIAITLLSCEHRSGSGNIVTEMRETGDFSTVIVGGAFTVEITPGPETSVKVESDDNIIKSIETKVTDGKLKIRTRTTESYNDAHFKVYITAPTISKLDVSGAASVKVNDRLAHDEKIVLDASGASEITAGVDAPSIDAEVSGAATVVLKGRTRNYKAKVSGSGTLKSADLQSEQTEVRVSGAGSARVHASLKLKADASGAGNIYYKGGATVDEHTSGAGNVTRDN